MENWYERASSRSGLFENTPSNKPSESKKLAFWTSKPSGPESDHWRPLYDKASNESVRGPFKVKVYRSTSPGTLMSAVIVSPRVKGALGGGVMGTFPRRLAVTLYGSSTPLALPSTKTR